MSDMKPSVCFEWRQLVQNAFLEFDPEKAVERIDEARRAVLKGIEGSSTHAQQEEQSALRDALSSLDGLRRITKQQNTQLKAS